MEFVQPLMVGIKQYWFECELILLCFHSYIGDCSAESCPLFRVLRHRTPSSPMYLSEVIRKPFVLSRVFLLFSGGKSVLLMKKKSTFTWWYSSIYARSLKDQVRKSKYPRT